MSKLTGKRATAPSRPALPQRRSQSAWTPPLRKSAYIAAKAVGSFVPQLTKKAFEKYGFSTAALLTDWALIAGPELAAATLPERVKWPRQHAESPNEAEAVGGSRAGATLVLRVDPARALDVEYRATQIIDRINRYFGYRAIADLRLLQAPVVAAVAPSRPRAAAPAAAATALDPLTAALARFEAGVLARSRSA